MMQLLDEFNEDYCFSLMHKMAKLPRGSWIQSESVSQRVDYSYVLVCSVCHLTLLFSRRFTGE